MGLLSFYEGPIGNCDLGTIPNTDSTPFTDVKDYFITITAGPFKLN